MGDMSRTSDLTKPVRKLCDSLGQDQLDQIDSYAWTSDLATA